MTCLARRAGLWVIREGYPDASANLPDEVLATLNQLYENGVLVVKQDAATDRATNGAAGKSLDRT
jgi:hypothetical protein